MEKSEKNKGNELKADEPVDRLPDESDEAILTDEETRGNRAEEKIENRANKKQETNEEAKSITGSEPHHDTRNEHPDSGPAPLDRY